MYFNKLFITGFLLIILKLFLLTANTVESATRNSDKEDVIYFHNGRILRGEIIEKVDGEHIKILTAGRNVEVVKFEDIKEITRESIPVEKNFKESGFSNFTGIDKLFGDYEGWDVNPFRLITVNGFHLNSYFFAGLGTGFVKYVDPLILIPVFADFKLRLSETNTAPYYFIRGGYGFSIKTRSSQDFNTVEKHRGGWLFSTGIGIQVNTHRDFGWFFNGGYNMDHVYYETKGWGNWLITNDISYRRLFIGMGLSF